MKLIPRWKWENIWLVFIVVACLVMPVAMVLTRSGSPAAVYAAAPQAAVVAALVFGFGWGCGAILFGLSVDRLGVALANSLVIGLSSALGSVVPLVLAGTLRMELRQVVLVAGVATFLAGVWFCGKAGSLREGGAGAADPGRTSALTGIVFSVGAGIMSAIFNIGYSLALPIAAAGERLGYASFDATNTIWLLMLAAGAIPNVVFCGVLMWRNRSAALYAAAGAGRGFGLSGLMALLWGASIFLYGAATVRLGDIGPSIGWPLSLAVGLLLANLMGLWLGEWRGAPRAAVGNMRFGLGLLMVAIAVCAASTQIGAL
jgi:L-rhamnose-H+ transport protein